MSTDLETIIQSINTFVRERDWEQFHTPKNLTMALSVEVAELMEHFMWVDETGSQTVLDGKHEEIRQELADVFIYILRLSEVCEIDLLDAVKEKLEHNRKKYPADMVRGSAKKYDEY